MYDVTTLTQDDIAQCGAALRRMDEGARNMEEVANRIVGYLHDNLIAKETGQRSFALVRLFKTHPYNELDPELQQFATGVLGHEPDPATKCLTLLATAGGGLLIDHAVHLWDVASLAYLGTLEGHTNILHGLAFSPDGTLLATAGTDFTIRLWDPANRAHLLTLEGRT